MLRSLRRDEVSLAFEDLVSRMIAKSDGVKTIEESYKYMRVTLNEIYFWQIFSENYGRLTNRGYSTDILRPTFACLNYLKGLTFLKSQKAIYVF